MYNAINQENSTVILGANVSSYLASDLHEYTVYTFDIRASTRIGAGPSTSITARTDETCKHAWPSSSFVGWFLTGSFQFTS